MAQNHFVTKRKRRPRSGKRRDTQSAAETMRRLRDHELLSRLLVAGTPEAEAAAQRARDDIAAGRYQTFNSVEEFTAAIKARRSAQ